MKKLITILFTLLAINLHAQVKKGRLSPWMKIYAHDTTLMRAQYRYINRGHLLMRPEQKTHSHVMVLQVGHHSSAFLGHKDYLSDSLGLVLKNARFSDSQFNEIRRNCPKGLSSSKIKVYDNEPRGKRTIIEDVMLQGKFCSVEDRDSPKWRIYSDSIKEVMGHPCQKAEADHLGRHWVAWFSKELPYPEGPWLLKGLPGLVVEAYDSNKEHEFILLGTDNKVEPIGIPIKNYFNATREQVIRQATKYYSNFQTSVASSNVPIKNVDGSAYTPPIKSIAYNPLRKIKPEK